MNDILRLAEGERAGFGTDYMERVFKTQWQYQDMYKGKELLSSKEKVEEFISKGMGLVE